MSYRSASNNLPTRTTWLRSAGASSLALSAILLTSASANAFTLKFDYSLDANNFFDTQAKKDTLEAAGDFFEARITDSLAAIDPSGSNTWSAIFNNPATGNQQNISNPSVDADTLLIYVGGRSFGGNTLGVGGPGGFTASGSSTFFDSIRRGQSNTQAPGATDFGTWGGMVSFNSSTNWNFDIANGPTTGQSDFLSVAIHEIAHVLGYGTADSWDANVAQVDTDNDPNTPDEPFFTGAASVALFGGPVPMDSGLAHLIDGTISTIPGTNLTQEVALDPTITVATRKLMTDLDFAVLQDIGWEVSPVPNQAVPAPSLLLGLLGFGAKMASKRRELANAQNT